MNYGNKRVGPYYRGYGGKLGSGPPFSYFFMGRWIEPITGFRQWNWSTDPINPPVRVRLNLIMGGERENSLPHNSESESKELGY